MADIKINTKRLKNDNDRIDQSIKDMRNRYSNLLIKLNELNAMWDGTAKKTFESAYKDDMKVLSSLITKVAILSSYETDARLKYEICEHKVAMEINKF